jgi:hypothetical protein
MARRGIVVVVVVGDVVDMLRPAAGDCLRRFDTGTYSSWITECLQQGEIAGMKLYCKWNVCILPSLPRAQCVGCWPYACACACARTLLAIMLPKREIQDPSPALSSCVK